MTCRHAKGDPNCSSNQPRVEYVTKEVPYPVPDPNKPDASNYNIERVEQVGSHLVLMVLYPNCIKCSYEGKKIMVFLATTPLDALKWKKIDPHFREPPLKLFPKPFEAPSPAARFPGSEEGWNDALSYARSKS